MDSLSNATDGIQQVGYAYVSPSSGFTHAILWSGTAASAVDLNPVGTKNSEAIGVFGNQEVGDGDKGALLWYGTAASVVDLNPTDFGGYSGAVAWATNGV